MRLRWADVADVEDEPELIDVDNDGNLNLVAF